MSLALRPYQQEGIAACVESLTAHGRALMVWATGLGKTVAFAHVAKHFAATGRVLVIAHREELLQQARAKIAEWTGLEVGLERAQESARREELLTLNGPQKPEPVVVASIQSLSQPGRYESFRDGFSLVVVDEAHHATASTYRRVIDYYRGRGSRLLGVTATPDRLDEADLLEIFGPASHVYELPQAINDGWLARVRPTIVKVDAVDFSSVHKVAGDYSQQELATILQEEEAVQAIADAIVQHHDGRQTLVFVVSVLQAQKVADNIGRRNVGAAVWVHGQMDPVDRAAAFAAFRSRQARFLVNVMIATEGWDEPSVGCVAVARPTMSRALHTQMVGRGTRLAPEIGKSDVIVLDFVDNSLRHDLVCSLDLFAANDDNEAVLEQAKALALAGETGDAGELLRRAGEELDEAAAWREHEEIKRSQERDAEKFRREAAILAGRRTIVGRAVTRVEELDAFAALGVRRPAPVRRLGGQPASDGQRRALERFRVEASTIVGLDRRQASQLLEALIGRARAGQATYKQTRLLRAHGLDPNVSFSQARAWIDQLAANRWKVPPGGLPRQEREPGMEG